MSREWKPGDVAMVDYGFGEERMMRDHRGWFNATTEISDSENSVVDARPLIVIDFEDREQVERLTNALETHIPSGDDHADVQAVLREFANPTPPKPDEPQGLGAVVEDADGELWIRTCTPCDDCLNKPWQTGPVRRNWQIVTAVRVLSPGVTP